MSCSGRKRKVVLVIALFFALFFVLSGFLPTLYSRVVSANSFKLPCIITTTGNAWNGYIAFDLEIGSNFMGVGANTNYLVVMDTNGTVVAIRESDTSYGAAYNIAPDTLMFFGEPQVGGATTAPTYATHFWNLSTGATENFSNVIGEHDIQYDPINNTFLTLQQYVQPVGNNLYLIDKIVELNANGTILWSWNPYNHIPLSEASPYNETSTFDGKTVIDFTHANTLDWNYQHNIIYLNLRNLNTFYKINETSGNIIWACGEYGNFTLLGSNGQPLTGNDGLPPSLWYHCHDVKEVAPNVFTLFNNDYENNTNPDNCRSSLMEITLNETSMTAYVNWSWQAPSAYYNQYGGANILLPNGDFLGDFGDPTHQYPQNENLNGTWNFNNTGAVFVEVNSAGQVVRTFTFPKGCYVYRVEEVTNPSSIVFASPATTPTSAHSTVPATNPVSNPSPAYAPTPSIIYPSSSPVTPSTTSGLPSTRPSVSVNSQTIFGPSVVVVITISLVTAFYMRKDIRKHKAIKDKKIV